MYHVLFLCTANSARSIMAEALLGTLGAGRFRAHSAGSHASGRVHPLTLQALSRHGYDITGLRSKRVDEFLGPNAPRIDMVITLCDPARASCPVLPGKPIAGHWPIADPVSADGSLELQAQAFDVALKTLRRRVQHLTGMPLDSVDGPALRTMIEQIGLQA